VRVGLDAELIGLDEASVERDSATAVAGPPDPNRSRAVFRSRDGAVTVASRPALGRLREHERSVASRTSRFVSFAVGLQGRPRGRADGPRGRSCRIVRLGPNAGLRSLPVSSLPRPDRTQLDEIQSNLSAIVMPRWELCRVRTGTLNHLAISAPPRSPNRSERKVVRRSARANWTRADFGEMAPASMGVPLQADVPHQIVLGARCLGPINQ
jgi:hypothetical protein